MTNKKLRPASIASSVRHRKNTTIVILIFASKFTINFITWATVANTIRATSLNHKIGDYTMEGQSVIKTFFGESNKILYGVGSIFFIEVDFHYTFLGMDFSSSHV